MTIASARDLAARLSDITGISITADDARDTMHALNHSRYETLTVEQIIKMACALMSKR